MSESATLAGRFPNVYLDLAWLPQISREVLTVLHAVTGEHGTARKARVPGYPVGGKTGTVRKVGPQGYTDDRYVAWFAGIAPIDDPRIVTVVVINDPKGEAYGGGAVAAPVFSTVTRGALRLLDVTPTDAEALAEAAPRRVSEDPA